MNWQEIAVVVIVAGAVLFLARRVAGRRSPRKPAQTFVPLSSLKSRSERPPDEPHCH